LNGVLDRWSGQRGSQRSALTQLIDDARQERQPLEDSWSESQRTVRAEVAELEESAHRIFARHVEHLRQLQEWKNNLLHLKNEFHPVLEILHAARWFDHADRLADRFCRRLVRAAEVLAERQENVRARLSASEQALGERAASLEEFRKKTGERGRSLLVSRGRKRPESEFVENQAAEHAALGLEFHELRRGLARRLNHMYRAAKLIEHHAKANPAILEIRKAHLIERLRQPQELLFRLRENVLTDALAYEAARRSLRALQETVKNMRCVEDVYGAPPPFWKRRFIPETFLRKNG